MSKRGTAVPFWLPGVPILDGDTDCGCPPGSTTTFSQLLCLLQLFKLSNLVWENHPNAEYKTNATPACSCCWLPQGHCAQWRQGRHALHSHPDHTHGAWRGESLAQPPACLMLPRVLCMLPSHAQTSIFVAMMAVASHGAMCCAALRCALRGHAGLPCCASIAAGWWR